MSALLNFSNTIQWQQPWWFLLALQPVILWLILRWLSKQSQQDFADEHLLPWVKVPSYKTLWQKIFSRDTAYFLAWIGFALALANPQIPVSKALDNINNSDSNLNTGLDIVLVVDLSQSMYARDIKPSRLRRATLEAYEFLSLVKNARVAVVVYAARPHLFVSLTNDFNALRFYLKDLDSLQLPTLGGDPASALSMAQKILLESDARNKRNKSIIWMTDADLSSDFKDKSMNSAAQTLGQQSIKTYVLGIASVDGAEIPLPDGTWLEENGQAVISKPDFDALHKMTKRWGGVLSLVADDESDWKKIYQQGILEGSGTNSDNNKKHLKPIYQWFLFPALLFLFISLFVQNKPSFKFITLSLGLLLLIAVSSVTKADSFNNHIKQGAESYKNEEFNHARSQFIQSVLTAKTDNERAIALHNLGNALFQIGDYETANKLFKDALRYKPEQTQSSNNQALSSELFKLLDARKRKAAILRGNLTAPNPNSPLFDSPKNFTSTLNTKAINTTKLKLPELPKDELESLLKKGLAFIKLMQGSERESTQQKKQQQEIDTARQQLIALGEQESTPSNALWKRLFEIEEGFAGSLKRPEKLPDVKPW